LGRLQLDSFRRYVGLLASGGSCSQLLLELLLELLLDLVLERLLRACRRGCHRRGGAGFLGLLPRLRSRLLYPSLRAGFSDVLIHSSTVVEMIWKREVENSMSQKSARTSARAVAQATPSKRINLLLRLRRLKSHPQSLYMLSITNNE
jgi:hypothetical protein